MDDFETITGKVNNAEKPYPPPSREGSVLGNWKENGNDNSPSPKHPGKAKNLFPMIFQSIRNINNYIKVCKIANLGRILIHYAPNSESILRSRVQMTLVFCRHN